MKHLQKPELRTKDIISDCSASYRQDTHNGIKKKLLDSVDYISVTSQIYDNEAQEGNWSVFQPHSVVNGVLSKDDMCDVYDSKFVKVPAIRNKYYDHLMSLAINGKCPICGIGHASTLDHYLAKTIYPTYAVTPYNLVPVCKDCNFEKLDSPLNPDIAPLHPYYEDIDSIVWLKAIIIRKEDELVAEYIVCENVEDYDDNLYHRLNNHMDLYKLNKVYAIQASTEIAENISFWKEKLTTWGEDSFRTYLLEVLASKESYQRNTWNTALLRALINNIDILLE